MTLEPRKGEYLKNGIIFCSKCHTQRSWTSPDGEMTVRCACKCMSEAYDKSQEDKQQQERLARLSELKRNSIIGARYENSTFEKLDLDRPISFQIAKVRCENFCKNWEEVKKLGLGMYLFGHDYGTGKTELTACIRNYLLERNVMVLVTNFLEISKRLRKAFATGEETEEDIIKKFAEVDLLVIDDIGTEKVIKGENETFMQERIYDILNRRYSNYKPTIFTSNYSIEELLHDRGLAQKTIDRINEMSSAVIELEGTSYRLKNLEKQQKVF